MATIKMDSSGYTVDYITANPGNTSVTTKVGVWTIVTWNSQSGGRTISFAGTVVRSYVVSESYTGGSLSIYSQSNYFEASSRENYTFYVLRLS